MRKRILHLVSADKFTIPFVNFINKEFSPEDHVFIYRIKPDEKLISNFSNVKYLLKPYWMHFLDNSMKLFLDFRNASKIIMHGKTLISYFVLFPWALKKTYWVIQGSEIEHIALGIRDIKLKPSQLITNFVFKRVNGHISHIREDSELANKYYKSLSKFYYSPVYLSNVIERVSYVPKADFTKNRAIKILVGNSNSPTNRHASIFKMLLPYKSENIIVYSVLSYGNFMEYRDEVIQLGESLFGGNFVPIRKFMSIGDYMKFLDEIDIAVFNHQRQEAMGVTLQLLAKGKVVYMNSNSTAYKSFQNREIKVFDNATIQKGALLANRDVSKNPEQVQRYYSYQELITSWLNIFYD